MEACTFIYDTCKFLISICWIKEYMNEWWWLSEANYVRGTSWIWPVIVQSSVSVVSVPDLTLEWKKNYSHCPPVMELLWYRTGILELSVDARKLKWGKRWLKENSVTFTKRKSLWCSGKNWREWGDLGSPLVLLLTCFLMLHMFCLFCIWEAVTIQEDEEVLRGIVCELWCLMNLEEMLWLWLILILILWGN